MRNFALAAVLGIALSAFAAEPKAGDVVLIADKHDDPRLIDLMTSMRKRARNKDLFFALEGRPFETPESRKYPQEFGIDDEPSLLFTSLLIQTPFAKEFHKRVGTLDDDRKRYFLSQYTSTCTNSDGMNLWKNVIKKRFSDDTTPLSDNMQELFELLEPTAKKDPFPNPADEEIWLKKNQKALERLSKELGEMEAWCAEYVFAEYSKLAETRNIDFDRKVARKLLSGQLSYEEADKVWIDLNDRLREPHFVSNILKGQTEAAANEHPLYVFLGASHVPPIAKELRKAYSKHAAPRPSVIVDDALFRKIDISKLPEWERPGHLQTLKALDSAK